MHADAPVNMENAIIVLKPLQYEPAVAARICGSTHLPCALIYLLIYRGAETS